VPAQRATAQRVIAYSLDSLLRLLHPMIPFLTEEVWSLLGSVAPARGLTSTEQATESVCLAAWPEVDEARQNTAIEQQFKQFQDVLSAVRMIRTENNVPPKEPIEFCVRCEPAVAELLEPMQPYFTQMARATATAWGANVTAPERVASKALAGMEVHVDISAFFDVDAERARLTKQHAELTKFTTSMAAKLSNENFTSRAPEEVVHQQREKLAETQQQLASVAAALEKLSP
jgi:valyl-tRNA synthetase